MYLMTSILSPFIICTLINVVKSDCQFNPLAVNPTPIILNRNLQILYPDSRNYTVNISPNDEITIVCPGNQLLNENTPFGECITATCVDNTKLSFRGEILDFNWLKCQSLPTNTIRYTRKSCASGGEEIEIGYSISNDVFLRQIQICFDNINLTPIYSHYNLTGNIGYRDSHVPRRFFAEDGFYFTYDSLDNLYRRDNERRTINALLNLDHNSDTYIKRNGELFINRGHLTAKGDFVYSFQQLATFHYVNSAPQWASFNGGNWNELEMSLRQYADSTGSDLEVYTGIYGTTTLTNGRTAEKTELFLHTINGQNLLPVPQLFWKMIYNRQNDKGIVILGVNNLYEFDKFKDVICNDTSDGVSWFNSKLKGQKRNIELGYMYACSVPDFRKTVSGSPDLNVKKLLL